MTKESVIDLENGPYAVKSIKNYERELAMSKRMDLSTFVHNEYIIPIFFEEQFSTTYKSDKFGNFDGIIPRDMFCFYVDKIDLKSKILLYTTMSKQENIDGLFFEEWRNHSTVIRDIDDINAIKTTNLFFQEHLMLVKILLNGKSVKSFLNDTYDLIGQCKPHVFSWKAQSLSDGKEIKKNIKLFESIDKKNSDGEVYSEVEVPVGSELKPRLDIHGKYRDFGRYGNQMLTQGFKTTPVTLWHDYKVISFNDVNLIKIFNELNRQYDKRVFYKTWKSVKNFFGKLFKKNSKELS